MKVGTDGVLLGAWVKCEKPKRILDIGTGTGLIALMMAQRFIEAEVSAIEVNEPACDDASKNFRTSSYADRLSLVCGDFMKFEFEDTFDLIVCNPPFFLNSLNSPFRGKTQARHADYLPPEKLVERANKLLTKDGKLAVIYPPEGFSHFSDAAREAGLNLVREMEVNPTPQKPPHRISGEFQKNEIGLQKESLTIEKYGRHGYSEEYQALTQDFYLARVFNRT